MQPFAVGTAAALVVAPGTGIHALVFRLAGFAVDLNVIDLHIQAGAVIVGEGDPDFARRVGRGCVVLHAG